MADDASSPASTEREALIREVLLAHHQIERRLHASSAETWIQTDLTMAQIKMLFVLGKAQPAPIGTVAQHLGITLPAASHLTERLVQLSLVERAEDQEDRRRTLASLTPAGIDLINRLREGPRERYRSWLTVLADDELAALATGVRALMLHATEPDPVGKTR